MRKELEKYGIQMPAFSKIGGILESEVSIKQLGFKGFNYYCASYSVATFRLEYEISILSTRFRFGG